MVSIKLSFVALAALIAVGVYVDAAGLKGRPQLASLDSQRAPANKGRPQAQPQQQQQYLPPSAPQQSSLPAGAGQVAPSFTPARVQPIVQQEQQQQEQQQQQQEPDTNQQQQQVQVQQQEEVDPNAAAQDNAAAIASLPSAANSAAAAAPANEEEANPRPEPYAFQYSFDAADQATSGSSQREEQQDANGRVTGFYTLKGEDGRDRRVDYVADASGFRATISTNEMGTAPKDTADVDWNAQNPTDAQLRAAESATQAARQRALLNPQQQQQQEQQQQLAINQLASGSARSQSKLSPPRNKLTAPAAGSLQQQQQQTLRQTQQRAPQQQAFTAQQLQEPFEQIRQTELNGRARKSRHAPFYLFTV